jgi:hypothetical protein
MDREPLEDIAIVAEMFQIARTGMFVTKELFMEQVRLQFPNESPERLESCSLQLGKRLMAANYNNLADEYLKPGRHRTGRA